MAKDVIMPALGMTQDTGTLLEWLKSEGEKVTKGEPLMLVETDKTSVEIEASVSGMLVNIEIEPGDEVAVGTRIALIVAEGESIPDVNVQNAPVAEESGGSRENQLKATPLARAVAAQENLDLQMISATGNRVRKADVEASLSQPTVDIVPPPGGELASPKARKLAKDNGVDLSSIVGSGPGGAVLFGDVTAKMEEVVPNADRDTQHKTSRIWQVMANRLTESWQTVPHFYLTAEANMTNLDLWHEGLQERSDVKVTVTDLLTMLTAKALQIHPRINGKWVDGNIVLNQDVNVGLAVAIGDGLQVPVIHQTTEHSVKTLAQLRIDLVTRARENKLSLADVSEGTFTISNLGMFGIDSFSAIVNPPQAAILAVGKSAEKVIAVEGKMIIQKRLEMTLSCDHRVIDGATGAKFLQTLVDMIELPLRVFD